MVARAKSDDFEFAAQKMLEKRILPQVTTSTQFQNVGNEFFDQSTLLIHANIVAVAVDMTDVVSYRRNHLGLLNPFNRFTPSTKALNN